VGWKAREWPITKVKKRNVEKNKRKGGISMILAMRGLWFPLSPLGPFFFFLLNENKKKYRYRAHTSPLCLSRGVALLFVYFVQQKKKGTPIFAQREKTREKDG
jgi:hypothetical protein